MNRRRAFIISLAIGLAAITGVFAAARTVGLGKTARAATDAQVAQRAAALDRYAASLRKALAQTTVPLPPAPRGSRVAPRARVVYHRPPPIVVHKPRSGENGEGREGDD